jgi:hypothetical protein
VIEGGDMEEGGGVKELGNNGERKEEDGTLYVK